MAGPNPAVLKRRKFWMQTDTGKIGREVGVELDCYKPRIAGNHYKLERGTKRDSSLEPSEGAWPCQHLDYCILPSRIAG